MIRDDNRSGINEAYYDVFCSIFFIASLAVRDTSRVRCQTNSVSLCFNLRMEFSEFIFNTWRVIKGHETF